jgi:hypothetical protein
VCLKHLNIDACIDKAPPKWYRRQTVKVVLKPVPAIKKVGCSLPQETHSVCAAHVELKLQRRISQSEFIASAPWTYV